MMFRVLLLFMFFGHFQATIAKIPYTHTAELSRTGSFRLSWGQSDDKTVMAFKAEAQTLDGWLAFGFSPAGGMVHADILVGWIDAAGTPHISDRHSEQNGAPLVDDSQDYELLQASSNGTHLTVEVQRKATTCDENDWQITDDTARVIWAVGVGPPSAEGRIEKHLQHNRGQRTLHLLDNASSRDVQPPAIGDYGPHVEIIEWSIEPSPVPHDHHTIYMCKVFRAPPPVNGKRQMIRYDAMFDDKVAKWVHHINLFRCPQRNMARFVDQPSVPCHSRDGRQFSEMYECAAGQPVIVWVVGNGKEYMYDEDKGFLMMEQEDEHWMVEVHLDNTALDKDVIVQAGVRLYMASGPALRPVDLGMQLFFTNVGSIYTPVPPKQKEFVSYGFCSRSCTSAIPEEGIWIRSALFHMHTHGRSGVVRHIRNGKELAPLLRERYYDFNFQVWRIPSEPIHLLPGDEIMVECNYNTENDILPVLSGYGTNNEMCVFMIEYYPRVHGLFQWCQSYPSAETTLGLLGAEKVYTTEQLVTDKSGINVTAGEWLENYVDWDKFNGDADKVAAFHRNAAEATHYVTCTNNELAVLGEMTEEAQREEIEAQSSTGIVSYGAGGEVFKQSGLPIIINHYEEPQICVKSTENQLENPAANSYLIRCDFVLLVAMLSCLLYLFSG